MEKSTLKALKGSIKHWKGIVAGKEVSHGTSNCPLCAEFYESEEKNEETGLWELCVGCPVRAKTGEDSCDGSPYGDFARAAYIDDEQGGYGIYMYDADTNANTDDINTLALEHAKAELAFLQSLLPGKST